MSDIQSRIVEALEEHGNFYLNHVSQTVHCDCQTQIGDIRKLGGYDTLLRAHQAEMLAPIIREAQAEAWEQGRKAGEEDTADGVAALIAGVDVLPPHTNPFKEESND